MRRDDFYYELPEGLIAQYPAAERDASRLLCLQTPGGEIQDRMFTDLPDLLRFGDLLVFNDTRVIPARLPGHKETGGKVEILVERLLTDNRALAQIRASKSPLPGSHIVLENGIQLAVTGREQDLYIIAFPAATDPLAILADTGHVPLPPYIQRGDEPVDRERYQTVYAAEAGAVAAPTAGLHFSHRILQQLEEKGVDRTFVTLHVGAGTFQAVRAGNIENHKMHSEFVRVGETVCEKVAETRERGGRVIAVGTTSVRCLEMAAGNGQLEPYCGDTDLFIYPGYSFRVVDHLITNFHLPESSLLMLVSALAGRQQILEAYAHAVREKYRFFSYGDAMFITKQ